MVATSAPSVRAVARAIISASRSRSESAGAFFRFDVSTPLSSPYLLSSSLKILKHPHPQVSVLFSLGVICCLEVVTSKCSSKEAGKLTSHFQ